MEHSSTVTDLGNPEILETAYIYNTAVSGTSLMQTVFTGNEYEDSVEMVFQNSTMDTKFNMQFQGITKSSTSFGTTYNGFVGLGPYFHQNDKQDNLVYQLVQAGKITYPIVSIYANVLETNPLSIKFGGWDQAAIKDG